MNKTPILLSKMPINSRFFATFEEKKQTSKNVFFKVCVVIQFVLEQKFLPVLKQYMFSGNTFYHEKGKAVYHFGKSCENIDFIKFFVRTAKNTSFSGLLSLKSLFQRHFARF